LIAQERFQFTNLLPYPRLELLNELLADNGSIWVTIDDNEAHYLKVIMDEIFGRSNFVATVVWQKVYARDNRATIATTQDYIHVYAKNATLWKNIRNLVERDNSQLRAYRNPDNDPRGVWKSADATAQGGHGTATQFYEIILPSGEKVSPPPGRCWLYTKSRYEEMVADGRIWFGSNGRGRPAIKRFLSEVQDGVVPTTWWPYDEVGHNQDAKKEALALFPGVEPFATPKPERLLQRILQIATNPSDLVLDSFAGSGTTAAIAHKMGRRYIGIEMGEHAKTHCAPRLQKVIEGEQGGISEAVGWKGGGGFRFYELGATIFDADGNINPKIRFPHLAAHIWFSETKTAYPASKRKSPLLGIHGDTAYYLLYNGILGDKSITGGNVLTGKTLAMLPKYDGPKVVYGEASRLSPARLKALNILFKQTPYDVKAR